MNRPRRAKAKKQVQESDLPPVEKKLSTGDFYKDVYPSDVSEFDGDSDCSDYGKRSKKRKSKSKQTSKHKGSIHKRARVREPSPELSDLSEIDTEDDHEEDIPLFTNSKRTAPPVKATLTSRVLKLEVRRPTTININLANLFPHDHRSPTDVDLDGDTLLAGGSESMLIINDNVDSVKKMRQNPRYASFLELEPELRNQIYRQYLVADAVVKFNPMPRGGRETAILRVCKQVHQEGSDILYGNNAFHFERCSQLRCRYFDNERREVGYKDVRRFLETIGSHNIAKMRYLSIDFQDAAPGLTPALLVDERKFVNDPVLIHVLKMIGRSGVILDKFVVGFTGRGDVGLNDITFMRALTSISAYSVVKTCGFGHSRINEWLWPKAEQFMTKPQPVEIDEERRKCPTMENENRGSNCYRCRSLY